MWETVREVCEDTILPSVECERNGASESPCETTAR